jgi:RNA polymerase sigma-70 factor (ECF subfamily)
VPAGNSERRISEILADGAEDPEAALLRIEREYRLRKALKSLAPAFREAIVLRDIEGLSYEEVAEALNLNIGTVKSRIARGREELRKRLGDF